MQKLSIAVVEDSLVDLQEFPASVSSYHFNSVLHGLVTSSHHGDSILPKFTTKEAGSYYSKKKAERLQPLRRSL